MSIDRYQVYSQLNSAVEVVITCFTRLTKFQSLQSLKCHIQQDIQRAYIHNLCGIKA